VSGRGIGKYKERHDTHQTQESEPQDVAFSIPLPHPFIPDGTIYHIEFSDIHVAEIKPNSGGCSY
jgi:hypothetical protein